MDKLYYDLAIVIDISLCVCVAVTFWSAQDYGT